jgi:SnoaL-like domain
MESAIENLLHREAIRCCIAGLARGEDRRDRKLISVSFWPDAKVDYGIFAGSLDQYVAWVVPGSDAVSNTQHHIGQSHIDCAANIAKVETQVISYHRVAFGERDDQDVVIGGRYLDLFEKRDSDWRISNRTMLYDWVQNWGTSVDWTLGVMGMPFSAQHFAGRAKDDWSKDFFSTEYSSCS